MVTAPRGGANPCSSSWMVVGRNTSYYIIHAQATDTSGNVAQTDSQFLVSENPRD